MVSKYTLDVLDGVWLGLQNITLEIAMRARELGYYNLLFLSDSNRVVQVTNRKWTPT